MDSSIETSAQYSTGKIMNKRSFKTVSHLSEVAELKWDSAH